MATVQELSDPYSNFMLNPLGPADDRVCDVCLTFTDGAFDTCYPCGHRPRYADAILPISYSVHFGQLHTALMGYKRCGPPAATKFRLELAAVLWRFLKGHESCLAQAAGVEDFEIVTTVPSGEAARDDAHPLRQLVSDVIEPTRERYGHLLRRSSKIVDQRAIDLEKFEPVGALNGQTILLVDDTWTTGASVQSAAGVLKNAGAAAVGVLVIGRHVHEDFGDNTARLQAIARPFDWARCALE
jgi:hypothetical protein